ncbi:hypothetical protein QWZ06_09630 [Chryseobacterium tructae]|uniref:Tetratricopeptide repeat protein n=1 Tax=Chryseobacterium tructae TaxID=1037380 RepID=A0ABV7XX78_9FLAO|nr:hypothetical protein [Chryseobacterium tructae]MDN3692516.1 hypothetical protein [Chryseobacterium tructae]
MSKEIGHKKGMLISLVSLAVTYINKNDTHKCLKAVGEGIILAEQLKDYVNYTQLLDCKGQALLQAGNYSDSRTYFSKALKMSDMIRDKDSMNALRSMTFNALVLYSRALDKEFKTAAYKDSILFFGKQSYNAAIQISEKILQRKFIAGQSALLLGNIYMEEGNATYGDKYFNIGEKLFMNYHDKRPLASYYNDIGVIKFKNGYDDQALEYYNKALDLAQKFNAPEVNIAIFENLVKYYKKKGDTKKELYYLERSKVLTDSLSGIHKKALVMQGKEDIKLISKQKKSGVGFLPLFLILSIVLICAIFFYIYRKNKAKSSIGKFDAIEDYGKKQIDEDQIALLLMLAKSNDKQFLIMFQEIFTDLHKELLKFPELTSADLEMCAYLKLNIQTKEIATYKKVSIGAVDNRKYRIRKKLNLLPETDLYKWINTINSKDQ